MTDYKRMYFELAAKVSTAIELLVQAQQEGENFYIENEERPVLWLNKKPAVCHEDIQEDCQSG